MALSFEIHCDLRRTWNKLRIRDCRSMAAFVKHLEAALRKFPVVAALPPPADAPAASFLAWVQAAVHICEYSQAVTQLGEERVHAAACYQPSADMVSALVARSEELKEFGDGGGVCSSAHMIKVIEAETATRKPRSLAPRAAVMRLAQHGLSPKACWWLNGNIVGVLEGVRAIRTHVAHNNFVMAEALCSLKHMICPTMVVKHTNPSTTVVEGVAAGPAAGQRVAPAARRRVVPKRARAGSAKSGAARRASGNKHTSQKDSERTTEGAKRMSEQVRCPVCDVVYRRSNKARHDGSVWHQAEAQRKMESGEMMAESGEMIAQSDDILAELDEMMAELSEMKAESDEMKAEPGESESELGESEPNEAELGESE